MSAIELKAKVHAPRGQVLGDVNQVTMNRHQYSQFDERKRAPSAIRRLVRVDARMRSDLMKTTELLDVEQALTLIEDVIVRGGDEGENLLPSSKLGGEEGGGLAQQRLALRKSLVAAANLLTVTQRLMHDPAGQSRKEVALSMKVTTEKLKLAARGAYEAGHLLIGVRASDRS
jgi:hypothetical protein